MKALSRLVLALFAVGGLGACQGYNLGPVVPKAVKTQKKIEPVNAVQLSPNVVIVVDRSGSMGDRTSSGSSNTKWTDLVRAMTVSTGPGQDGFIKQLDDQSRAANPADLIRLGLVSFSGSVGGNSTADACLPGKRQVDPTANNPNQVGAINNVLGSLSPGGSTPTVDAMNLAAESLASAPDAATRNNYIVLLTDGAPNCNADFQISGSNCSGERCTSSPCTDTGGQYGCLDEDRLVATVGSIFHDHKIKTFVIGFGAGTQSGAAAETLDRAASQGGAPRAGSPAYYQASSADDLNAALQAIQEVISSNCTYTLEKVPADPALLEVKFTPDTGAEAQVLQSPSDYTLDGNKVTLQGAACDAVKHVSAGSQAQVEIDVLTD